MLSFGISFWDLLKCLHFANTIERGDRGWKEAQRHGYFRDDSNRSCFTASKWLYSRKTKGHKISDSKDWMIHDRYICPLLMWKVREKHQKRQKTISSGNCFIAFLLPPPCNCKSLLLLFELGIVVRYFTRSPKLSFQSAWRLCLVVSYVSWAMLFSNQKVLTSSFSSSSHFPLVFKFLLLPFKIVSTTSPQSWLKHVCT